MKTKRIILILLFISNLLFLPKICLAAVDPVIYIINHNARTCSSYSYFYFSPFNYQPPKGWEGFSYSPGKACKNVKECCQDMGYKYMEDIEPRVVGVSAMGYAILFYFTIIIAGLSLLAYWAVEGFRLLLIFIRRK